MGAGPGLDHLFPIALQAGTTNTVTAIGKFDPWPPKVWLDAPGIVFQPETNSGKFSVAIAADVPPGPHLVRIFNEEGSSGPRFLIVTRERQLAEVEPNDDFRKPQVPEQFPAFINGRLEKSGDVDSYAVELQAGQTLVATVEAYTLASPVDAVLRVVDARGIQVAFNHDGATLDPYLAWTARASGTYTVQLFGFAYPAESEVKFTGNNKCVYRLQLSRGPCLRHTLPLGVQRGVRTSLQLVGWNWQGQTTVAFDGSGLAGEASRAELRPAGCDNELWLPVGDGPELVEQAMIERGSESNGVAVPFAITGCIEKAGEEDRFRFAATKGEKFLIEVQSASLGFPLDAWLKVENPKAKELEKNDDRAGSDPKLEWTAPEDGPFVVAVGNVLHRGGPDYLYRLSVGRALPELTVNISETALSIASGKTNEVKVTAKRSHGFKAKAVLSMQDLPDNVAAEPVEVSEKGGEVTLKLIAAGDAKPFGGPIRIVATEVESGKVHRAVADLTSSTVNNGVPGGFGKLAIDSTDQVWLTVQRAPEKKVEKQK